VMNSALGKLSIFSLFAVGPHPHGLPALAQYFATRSGRWLAAFCRFDLRLCL
jgi:hypothetical protein